MADDDPQEQMRRQVAWIVTFVWLLSWPAGLLVHDFPIIYAQAPMSLVMGWLFLAPVMRRNNNGGTS